MEGLAAQWWAWVAAGMVLAILEVILPGYIFLGFAIAAICVGALLAIGVAFSLPWALVLFAALALVTYLLLRRVVGIRRGQVKIWKRDINE